MTIGSGANILYLFTKTSMEKEIQLEKSIIKMLSKKDAYQWIILICPLMSTVRECIGKKKTPLLHA